MKEVEILSKPIRILLVDDSPYFLEAARDFLRFQESLTVVGVATNPEEAITRLRQWEIDLVLLDLNLGRGSGLELITILKKTIPTVRIIVLTMMMEPSYRAAALQAGADDFVLKNDMVTKLVKTIHALMETSATTPGDDTKESDFPEDHAAARTRAEEALREREAQLSSLIQATLDAIIVIDEEQHILLFNPAAEQLFQCPASDAIGSSLTRFIPEMFREKHQEYVHAFGSSDQTRRTMQAPTLELHCLRADGELFPSEISISKFMVNGQMRFIASVRDITERRRAEARIQRQLERLKALREIDQVITSTFDMRVSLNVLLSRTIKLLDVDAANVLLVNEAMNMLVYAAGLGFRTRTVQATRVKLGESYAGRAALERRLVQIPNLTNEPENLLLTNFLKDEDFFSYHGAPLIAKGRVVGILEVFNRSNVKRDEEWLDFLITLAGQAAIAVDHAQLFERFQRKNAELEWRVTKHAADLTRLNNDLEKANRVKDEFIANANHEMRPPLNDILRISQLLLESSHAALNDYQRQSLHAVRVSAQHLLKAIDNVLD